MFKNDFSQHNARTYLALVFISAILKHSYFMLSEPLKTCAELQK